MTMKWSDLLNANRRRQTRMPQDHREQFERDYDRTLFSTPVRRLQDKAQVFPLERNDSVRTRLTHSLEVSAVARGLARAVSQELEKRHASFTAPMGRQVEAICATCGLVHDLGNPPFGHSGEDAIKEWCRAILDKDAALEPVKSDAALAGDFTNFEGNAQTLRLLTRLQVQADFTGLNLTYGTLSACCKYLAGASDISDKVHQLSKLGYFASERDVISEIRTRVATGQRRNPLTYIAEAADDIAYSVVDIEDGVERALSHGRMCAAY